MQRKAAPLSPLLTWTLICVHDNSPPFAHSYFPDGRIAAHLSKRRILSTFPGVIYSATDKAGCKPEPLAATHQENCIWNLPRKSQNSIENNFWKTWNERGETTLTNLSIEGHILTKNTIFFSLFSLFLFLVLIYIYIHCIFITPAILTTSS